MFTHNRKNVGSKNAEAMTVRYLWFSGNPNANQRMINKYDACYMRRSAVW